MGQVCLNSKEHLLQCFKKSLKKFLVPSWIQIRDQSSKVEWARFNTCMNGGFLLEEAFV